MIHKRDVLEKKHTKGVKYEIYKIWETTTDKGYYWVNAYRIRYDKQIKEYVTFGNMKSFVSKGLETPAGMTNIGKLR